MADELTRGGAEIVQQAKNIRDDVRLHGPAAAAGYVAKGIAHSVIDPTLTLGKVLASPENEMAGTPPGEETTGIAAYNRETERLAQLAATNVRNNTPGENREQAAADAGKAVRVKRAKEAILSPVQTAANIMAPGVFKGVEGAVAPVAERALGSFAGKVASRLAGESAAGAAINVASDPTHPISAAIPGAVAGAVFGEAGHHVGSASGAALRGAGRAAEAIRSQLPESRTSLTQQLSTAHEQRATAERSANHDALTGAPNVRAYQAAVPTAEADPNTAIVRFDVNGFKAVNDVHGHAAGDQTLVQVPATLTRAAADVGVPERVFRVGGDEFAAIVPREQAEAFRNRAEELYGVRDHGAGVKTSISGGVGETDALADRAAIERKQLHGVTRGVGTAPAPLTKAEAEAHASAMAQLDAHTQAVKDWNKSAKIVASDYAREHPGAGVAETAQAVEKDIGPQPENRWSAEQAAAISRQGEIDAFARKSQQKAAQGIGARSTPGGPPETIVRSAIKTEDGRIVEGTWHAEAVENAGLDPAGKKTWTDGFITSRGRFVGRAEADGIAGAADQISDVARSLKERLGNRYGLEASQLKQPPTGLPPGQVNIQRVPVGDINLDPSRFQYKRGGDADTGAGSELKGLAKFDEQLAGVVSVWRDPADGKLYAVNGHNRIALAKRTGHESLNVQLLPAHTAEEAKAMGALSNIAEGRGTALDAAQFFRTSGLGIADLKDRVSFKGQIANQGLGLSKLAPDLFSKVESGQLPESQGAVIGSELEGPEMQRSAVQAIESSGKRLSDAEVREVARQVRQAGSESVKQESLFGTEQIEHPLYVEKAQLANLVKTRLSGDRRLFGYVAKEGRAEGLARAGNVIDVQSSKRIAEESAKLEEVFNQLYSRQGPIADALTDAARRVANGEKPKDLVEQLYPAIRQAVQEAIGRGEGPGGGAPGIGSEVGEFAAGHDTAGRQAARLEETGTEEGHAVDSTDPNQSGLLSPEHFKLGALREPRTIVPDEAQFQAWKEREGGKPLLTPSGKSDTGGPERLEIFAVRTRDGTVIEGRDQAEARHRADVAGYPNTDPGALVPGFVTSTGRFVREGMEAITIAFNADQLRRNTPLYNSLAKDIVPMKPIPQSVYGMEKIVRNVGGGRGRSPADLHEGPLVAGDISEGHVSSEPHVTESRAIERQLSQRSTGHPDAFNREGPQIAARAIQWSNDKGTHVSVVEKFPIDNRLERVGTREPLLHIQGYQLTDGSFISRDEARSMFPDADFGPEGRGAEGALFSPEDEAQRSMFQGREGTAESRNLSETERHAAGELTRLRQAFALETDPISRVQIAKRISNYLKLLNRGEGISAEEMRMRAIAEEEGKGVPREGPDQGVLFSPATQPTALGAWYRRVLGLKNSQFPPTDVTALRKISLDLADAIGVPVREGRGNLKRLQASGAFWKREEIIRVRRLKALDTVSHEIGHYLSKKYDLKFGAKLLPKAERAVVFRELTKMGHDLYGARKPAGGYAEEGVAQWARFMVTDPQRLSVDAPNFAAYMERVLEREPALRDVLNKAHDDFMRYQMAPAEAKIGSMIEKGLPSRFAGMSPSTLIDHWFNDLKPIRRAQEALGTLTSMAENAANLAELTKGNAGRARDILDNGVIDFHTRKRVTPGLAQTLKAIGEKDRDAFTEYLVSRQVLTKTAQGIDTGFDVEAARAVVAKGEQNPRFVKAADEVWKFRSGLLDYMAGAGLMTKEEVAAIRKHNPTPTPFYRSFEDESAGGSGRSVALAKNSSGVFSMKGSDRPILDPLQSIVHDTYTMVDRAQKHYAASVLIKAALATEGGGHIAQLLPEVPMEVRRVGIDRVREQLVDAGWTPPDDPALAQAMASGMLEAFYQKARAGTREMRDQVLPILIDGERKWVQINDHSTWEALQGMDVPGLGAYERILTAPTRMLRLGATQANPDFAIINPLRDAFTAAIYSEAGNHLPGWHLANGVAHLISERLGFSDDAIVDRWAQEGGENAGMIGSDKRAMTKEYIRTVHEMMRDKQTAFRDQLTHPIQTMRSLFEIFENGTRLGEFRAVRAQKMRAGMPEIEASIEGAYSARNVTQDFFKSGRTSRIVNRYVPFFAAQLGDIYKIGQEFNPANFLDPSKRSRAASVYARSVAYVTIPSITLYLLQKDDPDYQEIPEYYKANAWVIVDKENGPIPFRLSSGRQIRVWAIPRPYLLGYTFGYMPEKILEWGEKHDPKVLTNLAENAWSAFMPSWIPTIAAPLIENYANRSTYSGKAIVPRTAEGLDPSEQSQPYTGETARVIGKTVGYSPAKIENTIRAYTGGAGMTALGASDLAIRKAREVTGHSPLKPNPTTAADPLDRLPVVGRFILPPPGAGSKSVSQLFEDFHDAEEKRQTWRAMIKANRGEEAKQYLADNLRAIQSVATTQDAGSDGELRLMHKALGDLTTARRAIATQQIAPAEKAQRIAALEQRMVQIARGYYKYSPQATPR